MIKQIFFDNDCLASFIWVKREDIMLNLYSGLIVVPQAVVDELSAVNILYQRLNNLVNNGQVIIEDIDYGTEAYDLFSEFTEFPKNGRRIIGNGEAMVLALAKTQNGIVASNNLRDIVDYVKEMKLQLITTGEIMKEAYNKKIFFLLS